MMVPKTRQYIILCIGLVAVSAVFGWGFGDIQTDDVLLVLLPIVTGFFTLLKGE
jgi:hypothetical protein